MKNDLQMAEENIKEGMDELSALKTVLKWEIQHLLQRLAETGEEGLVLTVSVSDGDITELGSLGGQGFLSVSDLENLKLEFLSYCQGLGEGANSVKSQPTDTVSANRKVETSLRERRKRKKKTYLQRTKLPRIDGKIEGRESNSATSNDKKITSDDEKCEDLPLTHSTSSSFRSRRKGNPHKMISSWTESTFSAGLLSCQNKQDMGSSDECDLPDVTADRVSVEKVQNSGQFGENDLKQETIPYDSESSDVINNQTGSVLKNTLSNQTGSRFSDILDDQNGLVFKDLLDNQTGSVLGSFSGAKSESVEQISGSNILKDEESSLSDSCGTDAMADSLYFDKGASFPETGCLLSDLNQKEKGITDFQSSLHKTKGQIDDALSSDENILLAGRFAPVFPAFESQKQSNVETENSNSSILKTFGKSSLCSPSSGKKKSAKRVLDQRIPKSSPKYSFKGGETTVNLSERKKHFKPISQDENPAETALLDASKLGIGRYHCPMCLQTTRDRHDLKRHLRTHAKDKPFKCKYCGKEFTRKWDVENHEVKFHKEGEPVLLTPPTNTKRNGKSKNEPCFEMSYEQLVEFLLIQKNIPVPIRTSKENESEVDSAVPSRNSAVSGKEDETGPNEFETTGS